MKKLLSFVFLALAMIAFTIGGCKKKAESEHPSVEQPSKTEEHPSEEQPAVTEEQPSEEQPSETEEHPTEHPE